MESVLEVTDILERRRPDLKTSTIPMLTDARARLTQDELSEEDLEWLDQAIGYLCHFKCLYDFCPLERLDGESDQERWQRWGRILDRMRDRAALLCGGVPGKNGKDCQAQPKDFLKKFFCW